MGLVNVNKQSKRTPTSPSRAYYFWKFGSTAVAIGTAPELSGPVSSSLRGKSALSQHKHRDTSPASHPAFAVTVEIGQEGRLQFQDSASFRVEGRITATKMILESFASVLRLQYTQRGIADVLLTEGRISYGNTLLKTNVESTVCSKTEASVGLVSTSQINASGLEATQTLISPARPCPGAVMVRHSTGDNLTSGL
ncbi:hypothetical protein BC827DRAFT_1153874 [Russula dissimulans]|nr:hypothetical protein BC827DRAFT_1153874 [Russula dissimulans]